MVQSQPINPPPAVSPIKLLMELRGKTASMSRGQVPAIRRCSRDWQRVRGDA
jgi:hypothetical protein